MNGREESIRGDNTAAARNPLNLSENVRRRTRDRDQLDYCNAITRHSTAE